MRKFNITGLCVPKMHYMVDTTPKIEKIIEMVDEGLYFTINRARQFGKTTTLSFLRRRLADKYFVAKTSFEGVGTDAFNTIELFCDMFTENLADGLSLINTPKEAVSLLYENKPKTIKELDRLITELCKKCEKPIVLMIDEVDKTSHNQNFLDFLGMLRNKYLARSDGDDYTFQSVILAGVYDIKNLKRKIVGDQKLAETGERSYNSPWNIAADFKVDMSFKPSEIATMLVDYENDKHTGMNISEISEEIYKYTNGYPFLSSKICKLIDEDLDKNWTTDGVRQAVKLLLKDRNTLFDDLFKNLENNQKLYDLIFDVMMSGQRRSFAIGNPEIELGSMFGILIDKDGKAAVANQIFELLISDYLVSKTEADTDSIGRVAQSQMVENGKFNMPLCLEKFSKHFYEVYNDKDLKFLERQGRLLFITYLKPLINGQGFCHIETETRDALRMDLVVDYGAEQFIIELKLWDGEKAHAEAYAQLCKYLDTKGANNGYLLTFDFRKEKKNAEPKWIEYQNKKIFDVIV